MSGTTSGTLPVENQNGGRRLAVRKLIATAVVILSFFPLGLFLFSLLGRHFFLAELVGNFRAQILVLLLPFPLLLWILKRPKWSLLLAVAMAWCAIGVFSIYLPGAQPPAGPQKLKLMSFNVWDENQDDQDVIAVIEDEDPDILFVLEYCGHWTKSLRRIEDRYPYKILEPRWHGFGIAVFSKDPFLSSEVHQIAKTSTDTPTIIFRMKLGDQTLRVAGIHTLSPTDHVRLEIRNEQLAEISKLLTRSTEPTIVMGDFNCTPWSPFLRDVIKKTGFRDSRQGFGIQASWPAELWPLRIPIDQAFVSEQIHVHERRLGENAGSDHFPLIIEMSIAGP